MTLSKQILMVYGGREPAGFILLLFFFFLFRVGGGGGGVVVVGGVRVGLSATAETIRFDLPGHHIGPGKS